MANELLEELKKAQEIVKSLSGDQAKELQKILKDIESSGAMKNLANDTEKAKKAASEFNATLTPIKDTIEEMRAKSGGLVNSLVSGFGAVAAAIYNTSNASMSAGQSFAAAWDKSTPGKLIGGIDEATKMSKEFRGEALRIGSEFGQGFDEAKRGYQDYAGAVFLAQSATYESRAAVEQQIEGLARMGISLGEMSKTVSVAGTQQNMLTQGFLLAQDSGLETSRVFDMMAVASRKMGLSVEDSARPLLALESIAKSTGLPITDLSSKVFGLSTQYARFGMSVESLSPILRRFTSVLGDGFKGLAIDDTMALVSGLARQVNTTNAAFLAMQSGMARPGAGVAGAMLDFEDAMAEPDKAMKMLAGSLSNISGGKILTMQDAHASEAAATQFKLQRDMLTQLTGINDPQQTRTLMSLLADQQSGKALTTEENRTLADAMKSGSNKQEEQRSLAEKIGKAQVGLLGQIALSMSNFAASKITPGTESAIVGGATRELSAVSAEGREFASRTIGGYIDKGIALADDYFAAKAPESVKNAAKSATGTVNEWLDKNRNNIEAPTYSIPAFSPGEATRLVGGPTAGGVQFPEAAQPTPTFGAASDRPPGAPDTTHSTKTTHAPGEKGMTNVMVTFRGTDDLTKAIADAATAAYNKTLHGGT